MLRGGREVGGTHCYIPLFRCNAMRYDTMPTSSANGCLRPFFLSFSLSLLLHFLLLVHVIYGCVYCVGCPFRHWKACCAAIVFLCVCVCVCVMVNETSERAWGHPHTNIPSFYPPLHLFTVQTHVRFFFFFFFFSLPGDAKHSTILSMCACPYDLKTFLSFS